eukprot:2743122-Pyramimonas_sp.AAC.1
MRNAVPDVDIRTHRTLGYISNHGEALARLHVGAHAGAPARAQRPSAAIACGFDEAKQRQVNAEFASNFADALTSAQWP